MTPIVLSGGQTVSVSTGSNQSISIWAAYAGSIAAVTITDNDGKQNTVNLGPQMFRYTSPLPKNTVKIAVLSGMVSYETVGAADKGNLNILSTRTSTTETLNDLDNDYDVVFTAGGATAATVANNVPQGWAVNCIQRGGVVTFAVQGGALLSRSAFTKTAGTNAMVTLRCISNAGTAPQIVLTGDGAP